MIVLDASAAIDLLLGLTASGRLRVRLGQAQGLIVAPHLIDLEVAQVLRRFVSLGKLDAVRAEEALGDFSALGIRRQAHDVLLPRVWELRHNATAYDAAYLALSEVVRAPLITCDPKMSAVPGSSAVVEVFG